MINCERESEVEYYQSQYLSWRTLANNDYCAQPPHFAEVYKDMTVAVQ